MTFKFNWIGTGFVLLGIILTNINFYPLNIFLHGFGVLMWTIHGFILKIYNSKKLTVRVVGDQ